VGGDFGAGEGRAEDAALSEQRWEDGDGGVAAATFSTAAAATADATVTVELRN
jgi:hypothetical protein